MPILALFLILTGCGDVGFTARGERNGASLRNDSNQVGEEVAEPEDTTAQDTAATP